MGSVSTAEGVSIRPGHVGLNVADLDRSRAFYEAVFGFRVVHASETSGRRFAFLGDGERLVLTLWQQAEGRFPTRQPGLHHLAFEVAGLDEVLRAERTLRDLGVPIIHGGIVAHQEGAESGGLFFEDPDGIRLEISSPAGLAGKPAPTGDAPACGFF
ncbi:MAG: VOC family protein [Chloroflexia bacterium]|nr:VOC family protein [Chloroflexia bacterium]